MADVRPFRGLRFDPRRVDLGAVTCPPFDVITPDEQAAYHARDAHNIIRVELGRGPTDPAAPGNRYAAAAKALRRWQSEGVLVREASPAFYLYEHQFTLGDGACAAATRTRRGLLAAVRLHDWSEGVVLPHEDTRTGPKLDRLALLRATDTNVSPLWLLYDDRDGRVAEALNPHWALPPVGVADVGRERHVVRAVAAAAELRAVSAAFDGRRLYIADGHHRYETAQRYRDARRAAAGSQAAPNAGYEYALMLLVAVDDPGLVVLPTHRLVRGTGRASDEIRDALGRWFTLAPLPLLPGDDSAAILLEGELARAAAAGNGAGPGAAHATVFGLVDRDGTWLLRPRPDRPWRARLPAGYADAWRSLDVAVLDALAIRDVCGIEAAGEAAGADATGSREPAPGTLGARASGGSPRQRAAGCGAGGAPSDKLSYVPTAAGAIAAVRSGEADQAFLLNPTRVEQVCAVAAAGDRMPPKSTFFFPKPLTGLVLHPLDGTRPRP